MLAKEMKAAAQSARMLYDRWFETDNEVIRGKCVAELARLLDVEDPTGEVHYIFGQFIYDKQCGLDGDKNLALDYFLLATTKNPGHYMAHLYAGHCHHDSNRHEEALTEYEAVDVERFKSEYPIWRYVKFLEQKGECLYHVDRHENATMMFEKVLKYYEDTPYDDLVDPVEVFNVLDDSHLIAMQLRGRMDAYYEKDGLKNAGDRRPLL